MKLIPLATLIATCFPCAAQQSEPGAPPPSAVTAIPADKSFADRRFAEKKAEALEDHLAANPGAPDFRDSLQQLFMCYRDEVGDKERALAVLDRYYEHLLANADPSGMKEGLRHLFLCCVGIEAEDRALVALAREHAFLAKGADSDLSALGENLGDWVYRLMKSNQAADREKARNLVAQAKKDLAGHADVNGISQLFARLDGKLNKPAVGGTLEIAFTALDGAKVDLSAMKGKVVLVDFWATWCEPCIASLPGIKAVYDQRHDKGFEVIGISLDNADARTKVEDFVKNKNLPWPQSFEGKGWDHSRAIKYGITSIPATFLVGKDGKIAAIGAHGQELDAKVAELLK